MSTVSARTQFVLSARDQTAAGIGSAKRALMGLEAAGMRVRGAFAGMFAGFLGGSLIKNVVRSFIDINKNLDPVKNSFTTLDRAWQRFALNVGKGGLNSALIQFNERMVRLTGSFDGLTSSIGSFLGSGIDGVARIFEGIGRSIAFVNDNMAKLQFKSAADALAAPVPGFLSDSGYQARVAVLDWLKSMGFETNALDGSLKSLKETSANLPKTFKEIAEANKDNDDAFKKLTETAQRLWLGTQTPLEKYKSGLRELNVLQAQGVLIQDTYARRTAQLREEFLDSGNKVKEGFDTLTETGHVLGDSFGSVLQGLTDGTFSLKNALGSLLSDLTNLFSNQAINMLFGGGSVKGAGILGNLFGSSFGGLYAKGGTLGAGKWGIAGENGPEIVEGPASISPMRPGGGSPQIIINDYRTSGQAVQPRRDSSGNIMIAIRDMVNQQVEGRFGGRPVMARR